MDDKNGIDHNFIGGCRYAIRDMRDAGMNETAIACVVTEIRSAAVNEATQRLRVLLDGNRPRHHAHGHMAKAIAEWAPAAPKETAG